MWRVVWLVAGLCGTAVATAAMPAPKVEKISEHVYALLGPVGLPDKTNGGYMNNSAVIIGARGVILVDTGFHDEIGQLLKQTIARLTPKPVTHVINTHHHGDHTLGNVAFPGATVISAQKCKELVESTGYEWLGIIQTVLDRTFPNTKPVVATTTFGPGRHKQTIDGVNFEFWVPAGSHTPGDLVVYLPDEKLLIAGDVVVEHMAPSFRDAHVRNWIGTLAEIDRFDARRIIPGHGPLVTLAQVKAMRARMQNLYAGVEAGYKKGLTDSEVRQTLDLREWEKMVSYENLMGPNINRAYLEIEQENF